MKKLLSTITAMSVMTASAISVGASWFADGFKSIFYAVTPGEVISAAAPSATPTAQPSATPTIDPSATPTVQPTATPTVQPTAMPTAQPTATPTAQPTATPTPEPTATPTPEPTATPEPTVKGLTLNKQNMVLKKGESFKLVATTEPENAPYESVIWNATTDSVIILEDGTVKAVSEGIAIVSAMTVNSEFVASCYISVEDEDGTVQLSVTDGIESVIITKDGESKELRAGDNSVEAGVYSVAAKCYEGYSLKEYNSSVTVEKDKTTTLSVSAEKTTCDIILPNTAGVMITPVNGSASPVALNGSYSFTVSLGSSYEAENLTVKANGAVITADNGIYAVSDIKDDVVITIDGVESKSWDATLKEVKVKGYTAVLGADNTYSVTIPYGESASLSDVAITVNDSKSQYTITSDNGYYIITVKAEDGTTNIYKLSVKNASATVIDEFKVAISGLKFGDVIQLSNGNYDSQETVKADIEKRIKEIAENYSDINYVVEYGEVSLPVKGTLSNPTGTDGYYRFTVTLSPALATATASDESEIRTIDLHININSYDYVVASSNITVNTTTLTIKNLDESSEVAIFLPTGAKLRQWTAPTNGSVTYTNLAAGETYVVKMRAQGSEDIPTTGTTVTMQESKSRGTSKYYTVTFDAGEHGEIISGKTKQTVRLTGIAEYPSVRADNGYVFKGWSANGVMVDNPNTYFIRCTTAFTAIYDVSYGSTYSSSSRPSSSDTNLYNYTNTNNQKYYSWSDVPATSWYYNSVSNICNKGYMNGVTDTSFEPNSPLTRAMLVTILYRYASEPNVDFSSNFSDVAAGQWYSDAVAWASDAGIVNGTSAGVFDPDVNITREQLAAIMYRYCEAFGYDTSATGNIIRYNDSSKISDWAQTALIWTTGSGIMEGKDGNILDPQGRATRAEAAAIIERFDNFVND